MTIQVKIETKGALLSGQAPKIIQGNLDRFVTQVTMFLDGEVKKRTPQGVFGAQGGLIGSIQNEVIGKGTPLIKGTVMSAQKYAEVIEKGRSPGKGMPPKGLLIRWIETKLGLSETEAKRVEFVIRRSIGKKGFEGRFMFEKAVTENIGKIETMAQACGLQIAVELT